MKRHLMIGLDPGVDTGIAIWNKTQRQLVSVETVKIHEAMDVVRMYKNLPDVELDVFVEDARKRSWFGNSGREKLQGAGSAKRDAKIWDDFLKSEKVRYQMIHPIKGATKLDAERFARVTGWKGRTSEHARDAGMIVFDR